MTAVVGLKPGAGSQPGDVQRAGDHRQHEGDDQQHVLPPIQRLAVRARWRGPAAPRSRASSRYIDRHEEGRPVPAVVRHRARRRRRSCRARAPRGRRRPGWRGTRRTETPTKAPSRTAAQRGSGPCPVYRRTTSNQATGSSAMPMNSKSAHQSLPPSVGLRGSRRRSPRPDEEGDQGGREPRARPRRSGCATSRPASADEHRRRDDERRDVDRHVGRHGPSRRSRTRSPVTGIDRARHDGRSARTGRRAAGEVRARPWVAPGGQAPGRDRQAGARLETPVTGELSHGGRRRRWRARRP